MKRAAITPRLAACCAPPHALRDTAPLAPALPCQAAKLAPKKTATKKAAPKKVGGAWGRGRRRAACAPATAGPDPVQHTPKHPLTCHSTAGPRQAQGGGGARGQAGGQARRHGGGQGAFGELAAAWALLRWGS